MARLDGTTLRCRCSPVFRGLAAPTTSFTWSAGNWYLVVIGRANDIVHVVGWKLVFSGKMPYFKSLWRRSPKPDPGDPEPLSSYRMDAKSTKTMSREFHPKKHGNQPCANTHGVVA